LCQLRGTQLAENRSWADRTDRDASKLSLARIPRPEGIASPRAPKVRFVLLCSLLLLSTLDAPWNATDEVPTHLTLWNPSIWQVADDAEYSIEIGSI